MSKCDVDLIGLYELLFQDAARAYPALEKEFSKDYSTLRRAVETRGLRLITIDLVAYAKHFDKCLAQGKYISPGLPLTKRASGRAKAPKFLRGLHLLVFDEHGSLKENVDIEAIFFIRQLLLFGKKASYDCDVRAIHREVERFVHHDSLLPQPNSSWENGEYDVSCHGFEQDRFIPYSGTSTDAQTQEQSNGVHHVPHLCDGRTKEVDLALLKALQQVGDVLTTTIGPYDPDQWRFRHGPGAVADGTSDVDKYENLRRLWYPCLQHEFPYEEYAYYSYLRWADDRSLANDGCSCNEHPTSKLVSVPKTVDTPRLIAAEPTSKQWCQQNLLDYFATRMENTWINKFVRLADQTQNQRMCLLGSLGGDLCTIDLKAASDSVTCWFVGNLFRRNPRLLRALRAVRTRHLRQDLHPGLPAEIPLRKFSMMGSAVTFPIECIGFLAICLAGICYTRKIRPTQRNLESIEGLSVYGDDLIIPADSWDAVTRLLEVCYFTVNTTKSFKEGNFRESCGVDAFKGRSITPVYWRGPYTTEPRSKRSLLDLRNHLYSRWLMRTCEAVGENLRGSNLPYVSARSGATGLHSRPAVVLSDPIRYCNAHHKWKALVMTFRGHAKRLQYGNDSALHQYFTERPSPQTKWVNGVQSRVRMSMRRRWIDVKHLLG